MIEKMWSMELWRTFYPLSSRFLEQEQHTLQGSTGAAGITATHPQLEASRHDRIVDIGCLPGLSSVYDNDTETNT